MERPSPAGVFHPMKIREENRDMVLLTAVLAIGATVAGVAALFEPASARETPKREATHIADSNPVRIIGVPVVPNSNPRERH